MPTSVVVSATVTAILSTLTLLGVGLLGVVLGPVVGDLVEAFGVDNGRELVTGALVLTGLLCVVADLLVVGLVRRSRAARIALVVVCALSAGIALVAATAIVISLVHAVAAVAVAVLLLLDDSARWTGRRDTPAAS